MLHEFDEEREVAMPSLEEVQEGTEEANDEDVRRFPKSLSKRSGCK